MDHQCGARWVWTICSKCVMEVVVSVEVSPRQYYKSLDHLCVLKPSNINLPEEASFLSLNTSFLLTQGLV